MSGAYYSRPQYTQDTIGPNGGTGDQQFCLSCGAGIGQYRRAGEGTCPKCDPIPEEKI
jgi:hypothetical protein